MSKKSRQKPPNLNGTRRRFRRRRVRQDGEPSAIDLIEEGMHLLRQVPLVAWAVYMCGVAPFIFGFLFFWTEMVSSGLADRSLLPGALGLGVLFVWFKVTQAYFGDGLREALHGSGDAAWSFEQWMTVLRRQAFWQPTGLILLPIAFALTIPFGWAFAFYQNVLVADPREDVSDGDVVRESWRLARLWPEQNWTGLALLGVVYLLSFINWLTVLIVGPYLLKTLLGIETVFSRSGFHLLNTTSLFVCCLLAYVVTDPLVKAVYLLRRHYCESRRSGADLLLRLRRTLPRRGLGKSALVVLGLLMVWPMVAPSSASLAAEVSQVSGEVEQVEAASLDASIDKVLERREFVWRFPREEMGDDVELEISWLKSLQEMLKRWEEGVEHWIEQLFDSEEKDDENSWDWDGFAGIGDVLSYALIACFVLIVVYFAVRAWRMYQPVEAIEGSADALAEAVPDLNSEDVAADLLPRNRWVEMAQQLIAKGEFRLALRAYFLAQLSALASEEIVVIRLAKSNRDYSEEIGRRAHGQIDLLDLYRQEMRLFESVWYGDRKTGPEEISEMERYLTESGVLA